MLIFFVFGIGLGNVVSYLVSTETEILGILIFVAVACLPLFMGKQLFSMNLSSGNQEGKNLG
jgi:hypothetical protein